MFQRMESCFFFLSISMKYMHASFCSPVLPSMPDTNMCVCVLIFDSIGTQFEKKINLIFNYRAIKGTKKLVLINFFKVES